jgi:hypothetical protein
MRVAQPLVKGGAPDSLPPPPRGCNMVTPTVPITTAPLPENTLAFLTIPTVMVQTTAPQPGMEPLLEQQHAYQEEQ